MNKKSLKIFDTTLRDGTQAEGFSLGVKDKITIAKALDELGVHYIEGGWPGSNPRDAEFFEAMKTIKLKNAKLCAFGATYHKKFSGPHECPSLQKTVQMGVKTASIFGKCWKLHSESLLGISAEKNFELIEKSVRFLKEHNMEVIFDAEHFFDGYIDDKNFAMGALQSAVNGGANNLSLCETNGGMLPEKIFEIVTDVVKTFPHVEIGIHAHNDGELAVANSLAAIRAGATLIQGTLNGIGERCGNANLCSIIPNIELKTEYTCIGKKNLSKLKETALIMSARGNYRIPRNLPFVGKSAFAHKGGIHVSAVRKNPLSYESINPESVGNQRRITISDLSGKSNLQEYARKNGYDVESFDTNFWTTLLQDLKKAENKGIQFEGAGASFDLFFKRHLPNYSPAFEIENFFVHTSKKEAKTDSPMQATVEGKVAKENFLTAGKGFGPIAALETALRKALIPHYPTLKNIELTDYKVRIVEMSAGTDAKTRVVIEYSANGKSWNVVGVSKNIIEASMDAILDAYEYYLLEE